LVSRIRPGAIWPLAVAGVFALAHPALAQKSNTVEKPKAQTTGQAKPGANKPGASKPDAKSKAEAKPKTDPKATAKPAAKPAAKTAVAGSKSVPFPPARPGAKAAPGQALAPPVAAALKPSLAQEEGFEAPPRQSGSADSLAKPSAIPQPATTIITAAAIDVAAVKRAVEMVRNGKVTEAGDVKRNISDPVAQKLVEWVILRSDDSGADFSRYVAFISANPNWPGIVTLRRKAEAAAFSDRPDAGRVAAYFSQWPPLSAKGKFAHARALAVRGDRKGADELVRNAWRNDGFSQDVESKVYEAFSEVLTRADHKARMDRRLYEKDDTEAGIRAAQRLGGNEVTIARARSAAVQKGANKAVLDTVPAAARDDIGYKFARIQMLRRSDQLTEAMALIKTIPKPLGDGHDHDEWWKERRVLARSLLDAGNAKDAYLVARDATDPDSPNYRAEHHFMAGWIALRYLNEPSTAYGHFVKISEGNENPISLARGAYWSGRAAEAMHRMQEARRHYQEAARYPTAYYGQIARAKAGLGELTLNAFPTLSSSERTKASHADVVRAAELLYAVEARDLAWAMMADYGDKSNDIGTLVLMSELTAKYKDARGMLLVGKLALARGVALDHPAFPTIGVPNYTPIGPPVEPAIVYSIVRQESWFNPKTVSSANALGLMQVTPPAGRYIAKKFNATFDQKRLLTDMPYNVQFGAAELGDLLKDYRGSYIMTFAGYNAGRGRVRDWIARYGDPRDPKVDPIDWVERIPFSETRNYVQRVMENMQVYRVRFGGTQRLLIEADLRRGSAAEN
jgi:soluble lytic murein transglycosylase